jgi:hypothetical protein
MWHLWLTKWHRDRFFSEFFGFPLSASLCRGSPHSYITWDEQHARWWPQFGDVMLPLRHEQEEETAWTQRSQDWILLWVWMYTRGFPLCVLFCAIAVNPIPCPNHVSESYINCSERKMKLTRQILLLSLWHTKHLQPKKGYKPLNLLLTRLERYSYSLEYTDISKAFFTPLSCRSSLHECDTRVHCCDLGHSWTNVNRGQCCTMTSSYCCVIICFGSEIFGRIVAQQWGPSVSIIEQKWPPVMQIAYPCRKNATHGRAHKVVLLTLERPFRGPRHVRTHTFIFRGKLLKGDWCYLYNGRIAEFK